MNTCKLSSIEKQITLIRHELHQPNSVVMLAIDSSINKLNEILNKKEIDSFEEENLKKIKDDLVYAKNNSRLFRNTIDNIFLSIDNYENIHTRRINIIGLLSYAIDIFRHQANKKKIIFTAIDHSKAYTKSIYIDESLIKRAFINAYQNAEKYSFWGENTSQQAEITTTCENVDNFLRITISNYGLGVLKEELDKIWEEGYRGILSSDRHRVGSGLGLYQVKKIIKAHNGDVVFESKPMSSNIITGKYLNKLIINLPC